MHTKPDKHAIFINTYLHTGFKDYILIIHTNIHTYKYRPRSGNVCERSAVIEPILEPIAIYKAKKNQQKHSL